MSDSGSAPSNSPPVARDGEVGLDRAIGPVSLGLNAINLTVGAGIFALPGAIAVILGPAAIVAYLVCGAVILLVLACFVEVGTEVTRSGGIVAYIGEAFGPFAGFLAWVVFSLGFSVAADAAIAVFLADSLSTLAPALAGGIARVAFLAFVFGALAAVNIRGVRQGTAVSVAITIAKLVPLVAIVVAGAFAVEPARLAWSGWPSLSSLGQASLTLFFAFAGIESALTPSGEIRDPRRSVPRGILGAALAIVVLYVALQLVAEGVLGDALAQHADAPLAAVADRLFGGVGATIVLACAAIAVLGALAADTIGTPRAFLAEAEAGALPAALARIHPRYRTPWIAIALFAALTFAVAASGAFQPLAVLSSMALLLVYLAVALAALKLRARPAPASAFRTPGGPAVPVLAAVAVLALLAHSTARETLAMALLLALASLYWWLRGRLG